MRSKWSKLNYSYKQEAVDKKNRAEGFAESSQKRGAWIHVFSLPVHIEHFHKLVCVVLLSEMEEVFELKLLLFEYFAQELDLEEMEEGAAAVSFSIRILQHI